MNINAKVEVELQDIIDAALEIDELKKEVKRLAGKLAEVQGLIDKREDTEFDRIDENKLSVCYGNFILIEDLCEVLDIDFKGRKERWEKAAKAKQKIMYGNKENADA